MTKPLRVGLIGASLNRGWAKIAHLPALQHITGVELVAVVTSGAAQAAATAHAFGARAGYGDPADLFRDPEVDLITVSVKVPNHRELVLGALAAGKHVYCEWPLGRDVAEAQELAAAAQAAGVHVAVGLQARLNPALRRAQALLAEGAIGRVLSARMYSGTAAFGPVMGPPDLYLDDASSGATHLTIQGGHGLDAAVALVGGFAQVTAMTTIQYPEVAVKDQDRSCRRHTPDHLLVQARLATGGAVSVEVAGGRGPAAAFRYEVVGERGVLALDGAAPRGFQSGRLALTLNGQPQAIDDEEFAALPDVNYNVAAVYAALRDDIASGRHTTPDFAHAARLTRLVADVTRSASTGTHLAADQWPTA